MPKGAFNFAFVPLFSKKYQAGEGAESFARDAFWGMAALLAVFSVLAVLAMPLLVWAMAAGFAQDARFDMAVDFGRVAFPYILFISLTALLSGMLNAVGRFTAAAAAPVLFEHHLCHRHRGCRGHGLANWSGACVVCAGCGCGATGAFCGWRCGRAGFAMRFQRPRLTPELKRLAVIAAPAVLAGGVVQI